MKYQIAMLIIFVFLSMVSVGCWDRREIETLAFISIVGIDRPDAATDGIRLSAQIIKPFVIGTEEPGDLQERPFWLTSADGRTAGEASANLREESPRIPFWAHNTHVVVGEEFAREGVAEILGFFTRDPETRRRVHMLVVREARAEQLLQAEFELQRLPALGLERLLLASERFIGTTVSSELHDFVMALETEGLEPAVTALRIVDRPPEGDIEGELARDEVCESIRIDGTAVFSSDRMVGWMDRGESRGVAWARDRIQSTKIIVPHPTQEDEAATLRVTDAAGRMEVEVQDGQPSARVTVNACADLVELTAPADPFLDYRKWQAMEEDLAGQIESEIHDALRAAQDRLSADVFGFGQCLARQHPEVWEDVRADWSDEFRELPVQVKVQGEIRESGLLMRAVQPGREE